MKRSADLYFRCRPHTLHIVRDELRPSVVSQRCISIRHESKVFSRVGAVDSEKQSRVSGNISGCFPQNKQHQRHRYSSRANDGCSALRDFAVWRKWSSVSRSSWRSLLCAVGVLSVSHARTRLNIGVEMCARIHLKEK